VELAVWANALRQFAAKNPVTATVNNDLCTLIKASAFRYVVFRLELVNCR